MATGSINAPSAITTGSDVLTTTHSIYAAKALRIGRLYVANVTIDLTSAVSAWTTIFTLKNVHIPASQYVPGYAGGNGADIFYVGADGNVSAIHGIASGTEIKVDIVLILD